AARDPLLLFFLSSVADTPAIPPIPSFDSFRCAHHGRKKEEQERVARCASSMARCRRMRGQLL
ncbi:hypothetical protein, partial [Stenotrophomonas geniculata]|uniref:hypothetical protein n=1 Tax=Stenotrophomonas geniculata TaxID=86188 RepID=UPI0039C669D3